MRIVRINELAALEPDEVIPSIKGKIRSIFKQVSGTGDYGPWTLQNLELDAIAPDTGTAKVCLKDCPPQDLSIKGKVIYISCVNGDRGMTGVKWKTNKKSKKMEVSVTATAELSFPDGSAPQQEQPASAPAQQPPAPQQPKPANNPPSPADTKTKPTDKDTSKMAVLRKAHLMFICFEAANYALGKFAAKTGGTEQDIGFDALSDVATTLYIDAHRDGLHHELHYVIPEQEPKKQPPQQT